MLLKDCKVGASKCVSIKGNSIFTVLASYDALKHRTKKRIFSNEMISQENAGAAKKLT